MKAATLIVAIAFVPAAPAAAETLRARYLMGTVCEIAATKVEQIEAAFAEAKRIESMLSTWTDASELARVNRGAAPGPELRTLLDLTLKWAEKTDGAFDPRIGHLVHEFRSAVAPSPPSERAERASGASPSGGSTAVQYEEGAFGKGYALDRMLALLEGDALINFGGQIIVRGTHQVTVADPSERDRPVIAFTLRNASLSTSSGSHIIDPRTGRLLPSRGSVSVVVNDALTADILSTALYVMGEQAGLRWAAANDVAAIFISTENEIRLSPAARSLDVAVMDRDFSLKD